MDFSFQIICLMSACLTEGLPKLTAEADEVPDPTLTPTLWPVLTPMTSTSSASQ